MALIILWYDSHLEGSREFFPYAGRLSEEAAGCRGQLLVGGGAVREVQHLERKKSDLVGNGRKSRGPCGCLRVESWN